jgi:hypothetical protein
VKPSRQQAQLSYSPDLNPIETPGGFCYHRWFMASRATRARRSQEIVKVGKPRGPAAVIKPLNKYPFEFFSKP